MRLGLEGAFTYLRPSQVSAFLTDLFLIQDSLLVNDNILCCNSIVKMLETVLKLSVAHLPLQMSPVNWAFNDFLKISLLFSAFAMSVVTKLQTEVQVQDCSHEQLKRLCCQQY